jgi:cullin-4
MDGHRIEDVARLYVLAARVSALEALRSAWREYIKATGTKIVKDEEKVRGLFLLLI